MAWREPGLPLPKRREHSVVYKSKNDGNNLTPVSGLLQETLLQPNNKIYKTISKNEDALYVLK